MNKKRKVCVVITARASYARIKTALEAIRDNPGLELQLIVGASAVLERYGNADRIIEKDGFDINARVYMIVEGENLVTSAKSTGHGLAELATVFDNLKPDIVVTIADRFETLATAVAASYMNIPLAHVQGGEVTGSIDEKVRHAISKLADLHFTSSQGAADRLIRMGENPKTIFNTGCPSIDIAARVAEAPELDFDPISEYGGVGPTFSLDDGYIVVLQHPVTTEYLDARYQAITTLKAIKEVDIPTLWFWPNADAGSDGTSKEIRAFRERNPKCRIHFFKNMEPERFLKLAKNSRLVMGNSSVGIRECSYLGVPVVNIGSRQNGRERGRNVIDVSFETQAIHRGIEMQLTNGHYQSDQIYGDGKAGQRIADILLNCEPSIVKAMSY